MWSFYTGILRRVWGGGIVRDPLGGVRGVFCKGFTWV